MKNLTKDSEPATIYWCLANAYERDPLIQMLSEPVRNGLARAFHDQAVSDNKIILRFARPNINWVVKDIIRRAPMGWVGDGFVSHVQEVTFAALLPEGENPADHDSLDPAPRFRFEGEDYLRVSTLKRGGETLEETFFSTARAGVKVVIDYTSTKDGHK